MTFRDYIEGLIDGIPHDVYIMALVVFCAGAIMGIGLMGWKKGLRLSMPLLLVEYVFLIYGSTVVFRKVSEDVGHNFSPFSSYEAIKNGKENLIAENIMNVMVFVPVGVLLGLVTQKTRNGWRTRIARISLIVAAGLIISGSIETLQYFLKRGFSEVDDVIHNTLGCLIGFMIVAIIEGIWSLQKRYLTG